MNTRHIISQTTQAEALARAWLALRQYEALLFADKQKDYPFGKDAEAHVRVALAQYIGKETEPLTATDVWPLVANWTEKQRINADCAKYADIAECFPASDRRPRPARVDGDYENLISYATADQP